MRSGVAEPCAAASMVFDTHTRAPHMDALPTLWGGMNMPHLIEEQHHTHKRGNNSRGHSGLSHMHWTCTAIALLVAERWSSQSSGCLIPTQAAQANPQAHSCHTATPPPLYQFTP